MREKELLLILDNFEYLLVGVDLLPKILATTPVVKLLAMSREVLNVQEEWLYPLEGLEVPSSEQAGDIEGCSAVQLFVECARRVRPSFTLANEQEAVVRICQEVDGMPPALKLAATWLKVLPCAVDDQPPAWTARLDRLYIDYAWLGHSLSRRVSRVRSILSRKPYLIRGAW